MPVPTPSTQYLVTPSGLSLDGHMHPAVEPSEYRERPQISHEISRPLLVHFPLLG